MYLYFDSYHVTNVWNVAHTTSTISVKTCFVFLILVLQQMCCYNGVRTHPFATRNKNSRYNRTRLSNIIKHLPLISSYIWDRCTIKNETVIHQGTSELLANKNNIWKRLLCFSPMLHLAMMTDMPLHNLSKTPSIFSKKFAKLITLVSEKRWSYSVIRL